MKTFNYFIIVIVIFTTTGCAFLLPSEKKTIKSPWKTFGSAKSTFDKIKPYETTCQELKALGYDPFTTPNIKIINYLDIIQRFMENPSITKADLDQGLQDCIAAKDMCHAYEIAIEDIKRKRYGNFFLDILKFKRKRKETGWAFNALIVLRDSLVIYKLWGGKPNINEKDEKKNPLGPLQDSVEPLFDAMRGGL